MPAELTKKWYCVHATSMEHNKVLNQVKTLVADEPGAVVEKDNRYPRVFVYTALSWDFLREALPSCVVGIADNMNKKG